MNLGCKTVILYDMMEPEGYKHNCVQFSTLLQQSPEVGLDQDKLHATVRTVKILLPSKEVNLEWGVKREKKL